MKAFHYLLVVSCIVAMSWSVGYAYPGSNSIPYTESFEGSYELPYAITNLPGWSVSSPEVVANITNHPPHGMSSPYVTDTHTNALEVSGSVSNVFVSADLTNVYVDLLVKPQARLQPPTHFPTSPGAGPQTAAWVTTNSQLVFYHAWFKGDPEFLFFKAWTTNTQDAVPTNDWSRLTFTLAYKASTYGDAYFQVQVNGGNPYSNRLGYAYAGALNDTANWNEHEGGTWYCTANSDGLPPSLRLTSVGVEGIAQIDDLVVSDFAPPAVWPEFTSNGTLIAWLAVNGLVTNQTLPSEYDAADHTDFDEDGMQAWEEYRAGTSPTNPASVFRIVNVEPTNALTFIGGTNRQNWPFAIYRATNMLEVDPWTNLPYSLYARTNLNGSNFWYDAVYAPSNMPVIFYKISAPPTNLP